MGEFFMITILSVFAIYGIFDILYTFLFSETESERVLKTVIIDDIENAEYDIMKYENDGFHVILIADEKELHSNKKFLNDDKIHIVEREIFTKYF
ncbi:MAG: hypothetical protein J1F64_02475 [Oscillospiraceae bacterium]|nr:hypothetical protein [Oscillospiraceae bacterium]